MKDIHIQWHPAFDAALKIELHDYEDVLSFESEHLLSKKPMQIDLLIIKKQSHIHIHKNIGHLFKTYNIIEYKSPDDYLSINDFYKVYGYACFYQSDTKKINAIDPEKITITFVCNHYPSKLLAHVLELRNITVKVHAPGIYYLEGDAFPIQLIIIHELSKEDNYWLQSLRTDLKSGGEIRDLIENYELHKTSNLYQAIMNVILRANREEAEVEKKMCDALRELFADELKESEIRGIEQGAETGEACFAQLTLLLLSDSRTEDLIRATKDKAFRNALYQEYGIKAPLTIKH